MSVGSINLLIVCFLALTPFARAEMTSQDLIALRLAFFTEHQESFEESERSVLDLVPQYQSQSKFCAANPHPFAEQETLRVYVGIGYGDFSPVPFVSDIYEAQSLSEFAQKPCPDNGLLLCGLTAKEFTSSTQILEKSFLSENGVAKKFELEIAISSVGFDNRLNQIDPAQRQRSQWATDAFQKAFETADIVIYWGHNRQHYGPDFHPPRLLSDHVNYSAYSASEAGSGFKLVQNGLSSEKRRAKAVAVLGCITKPTFQPLFSQFKDINFITSHLEIDSSDQIEETFRLLQGLKSNICQMSYYTYPGESRRGKLVPVFHTKGPFFR